MTSSMWIQSISVFPLIGGARPSRKTAMTDGTGQRMFGSAAP
jgi:hypothetical protein